MNKILVVRNDKLGDFILALPSFAMLKASMPEAQITALVPEYTAPIAKHVPYIDKVIIDNRGLGIRGAFKLARQVKDFDVVIVLFSRFKTALAALLSRIGYRLAPASKIYQYFYNKRLVQHRSRSVKPEYEYNLDLVKYFLEDNALEIKMPSRPYLQFVATMPIQNHRRIIVHPGSGGSANNLSLAQFSGLIKTLDERLKNIQIIISAGPSEVELAQKLQAMADGVAEVFTSDKGLIEFGNFLAGGYLFIGGSTGPLHMAGAININTVGFYPNRRSATSLRWQTLNKKNKRLAFSPPNNSGNMQEINVVQAADKIIQSFFT